MFLLKLFLAVSVLSVPGFIVCVVKFIDERKWCCLCTDLAKKYIICIWSKIMMIKVRKLSIKVPSRPYWKYLKENFFLGRRLGDDSSLKIWTVFFFLSCCKNNILLIHYVWNLRNMSWLIWCNFLHVYGILNSGKLCFTSFIYIFSHFFSVRVIFFSDTLRLSFNFNNIKNLNMSSVEKPFAIDMSS